MRQFPDWHRPLDNQHRRRNRVLQVDSSVTATISGLKITGGNGVAFGGGIYNTGSLTVDRSEIDGNSAEIGGGIYSARRQFNAYQFHRGFQLCHKLGRRHQYRLGPPANIVQLHDQRLTPRPLTAAESTTDRMLTSAIAPSLPILRTLAVVSLASAIAPSAAQSSLTRW